MSFENRLIAERRSLLFAPVPNVNICLSSGSLKQWLVELEVPKSRFYANELFQLVFIFSDAYPLYPPKVVMKTPIFHPRVDRHGTVCLDILRRDYSAFVTVRDIIEEVVRVLENPTACADFETEAAQVMRQSEDAFRELALEQIAANFRARSNT